MVLGASKAKAKGFYKHCAQHAVCPMCPCAARAPPMQAPSQRRARRAPCRGPPMPLTLPSPRRVRRARGRSSRGCGTRCMARCDRPGCMKLRTQGLLGFQGLQNPTSCMAWCMVLPGAVGHTGLCVWTQGFYVSQGTFLKVLEPCGPWHPFSLGPSLRRPWNPVMLCTLPCGPVAAGGRQPGLSRQPSAGRHGWARACAPASPL
jgi:hypothetical protein